MKTEDQEDFRRGTPGDEGSQYDWQEKNNAFTPGSNFMMDAVDFLGKVSFRMQLIWSDSVLLQAAPI